MENIKFTKIELDIDNFITVCFNFYNQGVQDGDSGELDRFNINGEYKNDFEVFKRYFLSTGVVVKTVKGEFKREDIDDPLWTARVRREDNEVNEILLERIRKNLEKYNIDIPAVIDKELATTKNALKKIVLRDLKNYIEQYGVDDLRRDFKEGTLVMLKVIDDIQQKSFDLNDLAYMNNVEKFTEDVDKTLKESRYKTASESFSDIYNTAYYLMLRNILKSFEEKEDAKRELEEFKEQHKYDYDEEEEEE